MLLTTSVSNKEVGRKKGREGVRGQEGHKRVEREREGQREIETHRTVP